mgnify:CR=1 FL=1
MNPTIHIIIKIATIIETITRIEDLNFNIGKNNEVELNNQEIKCIDLNQEIFKLDIKEETFNKKLKVERIEIPDKGNLICDKCGRKFDCASKLYMHVFKYHKGGQAKQCPICCKL